MYAHCSISWDIFYQVLQQSSAQDFADDVVEEISTVQSHSEDEGLAQKAAEPAVLSRPPLGALRG